MVRPLVGRRIQRIDLRMNEGKPLKSKKQTQRIINCVSQHMAGNDSTLLAVTAHSIQISFHQNNELSLSFHSIRLGIFFFLSFVQSTSFSIKRNAIQLCYYSF